MLLLVLLLVLLLLLLLVLLLVLLLLLLLLLLLPLILSGLHKAASPRMLDKMLGHAACNLTTLYSAANYFGGPTTTQSVSTMENMAHANSFAFAHG